MLPLSNRESVAELLARLGVDAVDACRIRGLGGLEEVPVRPAPRWMRLLWIGPVSAMALPWAIYLDFARVPDPSLPGLLLHELVHVRQWRELGSARFLFRYLGDYGRGRLQGLGHEAAYRAIRLEVEARDVAEGVPASACAPRTR